MESRFWENFDASDYTFDETVCNKSVAGNDKLLELQVITPDAPREKSAEYFPQESKNDFILGVPSLDSPLDSFKQTNEEENVGDEEAINVEPSTDSPKEESLSSEERLQSSTRNLNQNFILGVDVYSASTNFSNPPDTTGPPDSKKRKAKRNYFQLMYDSMRIQQEIKSKDSVPNANAYHSLPSWDVLINPFQYEKPVKLTVGDTHCYANYVKLVKLDGKTIYFKLLKNPSDCDMKSAHLTLKFNKILWYFCAYTEIKISVEMEWNWHQNFPDSSSLFLVYPKK